LHDFEKSNTDFELLGKGDARVAGTETTRSRNREGLVNPRSWHPCIHACDDAA
jgi:hypothetical protein